MSLGPGFRRGGERKLHRIATEATLEYLMRPPLTANLVRAGIHGRMGCQDVRALWVPACAGTTGVCAEF
jgi:hypothetical protein